MDRALRRPWTRVRVWACLSLWAALARPGGLCADEEPTSERRDQALQPRASSSNPFDWIRIRLQEVFPGYRRAPRPSVDNTPAVDLRARVLRGGSAVPGAHVHLWWRSSEKTFAEIDGGPWVTDEEGRFFARGVPIGEYRIMGVLDGQAWQLAGEVQLSSAPAVLERSFELGRNELRVRVLRSMNGAPVENVEVYCVPARSAVLMTESASKTNEDGRVVLRYLESGEAVVVVQTGNILTTCTVCIGVESGLESLDVVLPPFGELCVSPQSIGESWSRVPRLSRSGSNGLRPVIDEKTGFCWRCTPGRWVLEYTRESEQESRQCDVVLSAGSRVVLKREDLAR